jgi:hypothetical protein
MRVAELRVVVLAAAVGWSLSSQPASADAVPPPPANCPPGYVAVTSHHGPECLLKTSTKCKTGYCAERGGSRLVPRRPLGADADGYGGVAVPTVAVPTPAIESATPAIAPPPAVAAPKPIASAKPAESVKPTDGDKARGGRGKGCTVSSGGASPTWLIVPLLAATSFLRRRAAARRRP